MTDDFRRIVTTHDATGKAVVLFDSPNPHKAPRPQAGVVSRMIWAADTTPADMTGAQDRGAGQRPIAPPPAGRSSASSISCR